MIKQIYTVYDSKTQAYNAPFFLINDAELKRTCLNILEDNNTDISRHPHDFAVFHLGEFDDHTGKITNALHTSVIIQFHELAAERYQDASQSTIKGTQQ